MSRYTGPQIDSGVARALPSGEIDAALDSKAEIEFLRNTDFTNPVAQAGVGGLHGSVAYALDRWRLLSGAVSWNSNGLTLNGTIRQIREFSIGLPVVPSIEMHSGTATITYDDSTKYCDITSSGGTIKRPHLGLREITDWEKVPKANFTDEMAKCRLYYWEPNIIFDSSTFYSTTILICNVQFPTQMRVVPAIIIKSASGSSDKVSIWESLLDGDGNAYVNTAVLNRNGFDSIQ